MSELSVTGPSSLQFLSDKVESDGAFPASLSLAGTDCFLTALYLHPRYSWFEIA